MSKIIKAAELEVLVPNESQTIIPAPSSSEKSIKEIEGSTLLKSTNLVQNAQRKAAEIIAEAEKSAESLVATAEEELETVRLRAKEAGFQEGYEEGLLEGKAVAIEDAKELLSLLQVTVEEAANLRVNNLEALEDDFLKLSLLLADKIVKKHIVHDISWLEPIVREALGALGSVDQILIRIGPEDYRLVAENKADLGLNARVKMEFEEDLSISQGGCIIESENGLIDARLEKRLGKLAKHLLEVLYDED